ncbi:hypothetical protein [Parasulfitobacter algicola]|uniref:Flagellar FliJ protein n=1 Tax=Parasulfitobacter algicola TaxID=2614809 RepID=A0ABX2IW43_9RHOB|nr:hypothetical protein [Sulfitobacter algicola]NSX56760.1 hypothetical protein [Sulfitobacter algicola]
MQQSDILLLLHLRQHRQNTAMASYVKAHGELVTAQTNASDAQTHMKHTRQTEIDRKQDAYRTLPGQRLVCLDLQRHRHLMQKLEAKTNIANQSLIDATAQVSDHQRRVKARQTDLQKRMKSLQGWQELIDQSQSYLDQCAQNIATIEEETDISDLFILRTFGGRDV